MTGGERRIDCKLAEVEVAGGAVDDPGFMPGVVRAMEGCECGGCAGRLAVWRERSAAAGLSLVEYARRELDALVMRLELCAMFPPDGGEALGYVY